MLETVANIIEVKGKRRHSSLNQKTTIKPKKGKKKQRNKLHAI